MPGGGSSKLLLVSSKMGSTPVENGAMVPSLDVSSISVSQIADAARP